MSESNNIVPTIESTRWRDMVGVRKPTVSWSEQVGRSDGVMAHPAMVGGFDSWRVRHKIKEYYAQQRERESGLGG